MKRSFTHNQPRAALLPRLLPWLVLGATFLSSLIPARAHFLWAEIDETGAAFSLSFAEDSSGITEGVPLEKINAARAWTLHTKDLALKADGAARKGPIQAGETVAGAAQTWGVLDKTAAGRGIFLLEYEAKAARSAQDGQATVNSVLELHSRTDKNRAEALFLLKFRGKPVAANSLTFHEPGDAKGRPIVTDANGEARASLKKPGIYGVRAGLVDNTKGELGGKKYDLIRRYATLTFRVPGALATLASLPATVAGPASPTLPNGAGNPAADPAAYALLKAAHDSRQVMPANFPGFTANILFMENGVTKNGNITYRRQGKTEIAVEGASPESKKWLEEKVMNLLGHRRGGDFAQGDGKNPLAWGKEKENNFGKLIELNDRMQSSYRVKDNKVTEVTRVGGGLRFTVSVMETLDADPGKYLANHFSVAYRDEKTGDLKRLEGYRDGYAQFDGVWIPVARYVYDFGGSTTPEVRVIRFRDIKVLPAN